MPLQNTRLEPKYKQMAFETAVRNPERYLGILRAVSGYEGKILDKDCLLNIVSELYLADEVGSDDIQIQEGMSIDDIKDSVIRVNSTRNADGGFPKGYPSRFWTYMRTLSELGFVYARFNQPFRISDIARKLLNKEIDEQEAFSIQAAKFNRRSPYRNVSNDYNFFRLAIDTILYLKERGKKLSFEQFVVLMFNKTGNISETIEILENNTFADEDQVYRFVSEHYNNRNKERTVLRDYPDVVRRLMIISGFITIRYSGKKFIEINENKLSYIHELMNIPLILSEEDKEDAEKFFIKLDSNNDRYLELALKYRQTDVLQGEVYTNKLYEIISQYGLDEEKIIEDIKRVESKLDNVEEFREIPAPLKLEFYISILLAIKYRGRFYIQPNYKADHLGKPYSHAPGNSGDINIYSKDIYWLVEVTLMRNRQQQLNSETTNVIRHLISSDFDKYNQKYLSLVAPAIHEDTKRFFDYSLVQTQMEGKKICLKPYSIEEFVNVTRGINNVSDMDVYSKNIFDSFRAVLNDNHASLS